MRPRYWTGGSAVDDEALAEWIEEQAKAAPRLGERQLETIRELLS
jgi:hypothetical protein